MPKLLLDPIALVFRRSMDSVATTHVAEICCFGTPNRPQTTPTGLWTTSNCSHMSCSHIQILPRNGLEPNMWAHCSGAASKRVHVGLNTSPRFRGAPVSAHLGAAGGRTFSEGFPHRLRGAEESRRRAHRPGLKLQSGESPSQIGSYCCRVEPGSPRTQLASPPARYTRLRRV